MARVKTVFVVVCGLMLAACSSPASGAGKPEPAALPAIPDELARQQVQWGGCGDKELDDGGSQCATVRVPLDYREPAGKTIDLAVSVHKATDPARRRGILLTHFGGPGETGRRASAYYSGQPISAVYDIYGVDPRGVGKSTPLTCAPPESAALPSRPTDADLPAFTQAAKDEEAACAKDGGELRKHITNMNTVRDFDLLRRVVNEDKASFLVFSYGTYVAALYGHMFPEHLDRSVLDSSMDPRKSWREQDTAAVGVIKDNVAKWRTWTAQRDNTFHLGTTPEQVQAVLDKFAAFLAGKPLGAVENQTVFDDAVGKATRFRRMWADLAWELGDLLPAVNGGEVDTKSADQLAKIAADDEPVSVRGRDPKNGAYQALTCDWAWPSDQNVYYQDMLRVEAETTYGGAVAMMAPTNCSFATGRDPQVEIGKRGYPAGIVIQAEGDLNTPYSGGVAAADFLDQPLVTVVNDGYHSIYAARDNTCVDNAVNAYLVDGTLPDRRTSCDGTDKPKDIAPDSARAAPAAKADEQPSLSEIDQSIDAADPGH